MGIKEPFPIQALTIPVAISGSDVVGQARTGTGKTLAFGLPLLQRLSPPEPRPAALVVVPTRELCIQVAGDLTRAGAQIGARVVAIYGGRAFEPQVDALKKGVDVVVGTPGRLLDLARQRYLDLAAVRMLVLDEADEMLDLGFLPDVEKILDLTPRTRQTLLFSATMPSAILTLSRRFLRQPLNIRAEEAHEEATVPTTQQHVFRAHALDKSEMVARILQAKDRGLVMVFCRTKRQADKVGTELAARGFAAAAVHGDLGQAAREQVLRAFRSGKIDVLVATDVAARGIDVSGVTHVVNYHCPEDEKTYLHRIGRTGRAGESGIAVTLVDWEDLARWTLINTALKLPFADPPETYSTSVHLREALDIPADAAGELPTDQRVRIGLAAEPVHDDPPSPGRKRRSRGRSAVTPARTPGSSGGGSASGPGDSGAAESRPTADNGDDHRPDPTRARNRRRRRVSRDGDGVSAPAAEPTSG